jgi:hypothetical protein
MPKKMKNAAFWNSPGLCSWVFSLKTQERLNWLLNGREKFSAKRITTEN